MVSLEKYLVPAEDTELLTAEDWLRRLHEHSDRKSKIAFSQRNNPPLPISNANQTNHNHEHFFSYINLNDPEQCQNNNISNDDKLQKNSCWKDTLFHPEQVFEETKKDVAINEGFAYDTYASLNQFATRRTITSLNNITCLYADLDFKNKGIPEQAVKAYVAELVKDELLPKPHLLVNSGNGLWLIWKINPVTIKELLRWKRVMTYIARALDPVGYDHASIDVTKSIRLHGTINSKNNAQVTWRQFSENGLPDRFSLENIELEYLGVKKQKLLDEKQKWLEQKRVLNAKSKKPTKNPGKLRHAIQNKSTKIINDLKTLARLRHGNLTGNRQNFLFVWRNTLCQAGADAAESFDLVKKEAVPLLTVNPLPEREWDSATRSAVRIRKQTSGIDNRGYPLSPMTIVQKLNITPEEQQSLSFLRTTQAREPGQLTLKEQQQITKIQLAEQLRAIRKEHPEKTDKEIATEVGISPVRAGRLFREFHIPASNNATHTIRTKKTPETHDHVESCNINPATPDQQSVLTLQAPPQEITTMTTPKTPFEAERLENRSVINTYDQFLNEIQPGLDIEAQCYDVENPELDINSDVIPSLAQTISEHPMTREIDKPLPANMLGEEMADWIDLLKPMHTPYAQELLDGVLKAACGTGRQDLRTMVEKTVVTDLSREKRVAASDDLRRMYFQFQEDIEDENIVGIAQGAFKDYLSDTRIPNHIRWWAGRRYHFNPRFLLDLENMHESTHLKLRIGEAFRCLYEIIKLKLTQGNLETKAAIQALLLRIEKLQLLDKKWTKLLLGLQ